MAYNGSGSFSLYTPGNPVVTGTTISSTAFNNTMNDIANNGLSQAIVKDGQTTLTANIPFAGFKITGLGAGTAATDSVRLSQLQNGSGATLGTIAGTNTITAVGSPVITAYAANQTFRFIPAATNTGATTLNIDGLGAKNIYLNTSVLVGGELQANVPVMVYYDGTQFNLMTGGTSRVLGTTTNNNAVAGWVGEYVESVVAAVAVASSNVWQDVTSISLGAGDWDVSLVVMYDNSGCTVTSSECGISQTSGNSTTGLVLGNNRQQWLYTTTMNSTPMSVPVYRQSLSTTTTIYGKIKEVFSAGGPAAYARLSARRVR